MNNRIGVIYFPSQSLEERVWGIDRIKRSTLWVDKPFIKTYVLKPLKSMSENEDGDSASGCSLEWENKTFSALPNKGSLEAGRINSALGGNLSPSCVSGRLSMAMMSKVVFPLR